MSLLKATVTGTSLAEIYKHIWHQQIAKVLAALPADTFRKNGCYFGGGTALVFQSVQGTWRSGEYRLSDDIDFLCTAEAFLSMRRLVANEGISAVTGALQLARDARIDQYGIRTVVMAPDTSHGIKLEIVCDAALPKHTPGAVIEGLTCLSLSDSTAHKLMANANRGDDNAFGLRDYLDLLVIAQHKIGLPPDGVEAAITAFDEKYIKTTLIRAHETLRTENYAKRYQEKLNLNEITKRFLKTFAKLTPEIALEELLNPAQPQGKKWPTEIRTKKSKQR